MNARHSDPRHGTLVALLALTACSFVLHDDPGTHERAVGLALLVIAFVKARLILLHFMEAKRAPPAVHAAMEVWVWGSAIAVGVAY